MTRANATTSSQIARVNNSIREGLGLLKQRDFARLFFAYLITYTGSAMAPIAMAFGVLDLTGSTRDSSPGNRRTNCRADIHFYCWAVRLQTAPLVKRSWCALNFSPPVRSF